VDIREYRKFKFLLPNWLESTKFQFWPIMQQEMEVCLLGTSELGHQLLQDVDKFPRIHSQLIHLLRKCP
jgi:hypothetical protein